MNEVAEMNQIALFAQQKLPGQATLQVSPGEPVVADQNSTGRQQALDSALNGVRMGNHPASLENTFAALTEPILPAGSQRAPWLDSLTTSIADRVVELKQLTVSTLSVVLRPDPQTELRMDLNHRGDTVEVYVQCAQGDVQLLKAHWAPMQESLARQGIVVASLNTAPPTAHHPANSTTSSSDSSHRNGGEQNPARDHSRPRLQEERPSLLTPNPKNSETRRGKPSRLNSRRWESWA